MFCFVDLFSLRNSLSIIHLMISFCFFCYYDFIYYIWFFRHSRFCANSFPGWMWRVFEVWICHSNQICSRIFVSSCVCFVLFSEMFLLISLLISTIVYIDLIKQKKSVDKGECEWKRVRVEQVRIVRKVWTNKKRTYNKFWREFIGKIKSKSGKTVDVE